MKKSFRRRTYVVAKTDMPKEEIAMKIGRVLCLSALVLWHQTSWSTDYYVDGANGTNGNAGKSWETPKKTIDAAYSAAVSGDTIHVADGIYGRISVNKEKRITIISRNGAEKTFIDGESANRCISIYLDDWETPDTNTVFSGFTIRNGYRDSSGGGAYGGAFRNCIFVNNHCTRSGGAAYGSVLENCLVISNIADNCAGAVYEGTMRSCEVYSNVATNSGGAFYGGTAENCIISNNFCGRSGGGAYETSLIGCKVINNHCTRSGGAAYGSILQNCLVVGNVADNAAGAVYEGTMRSCEVYSNVATNWGGAFYGGTAENCVIAGNSCGRYGGGAYETTLAGCTVFANSACLGAGGVYNVAATNSIIWANTTGKEPSNWSGGAFDHCVTKPRASGDGNTTDDPLLFSVENLDGRICVGSPCLDTGRNEIVAFNTDVAGKDRIQNATVDIGAYEGVVDEGGVHMPDAEKAIEVKPGVSSAFMLPDGSSAVIFGISRLTAGDFKETNTAGVLRYENERIIDAEKDPVMQDDDLWCQQMTEVNLSVWSGWAGYVGFTNEDDMADCLRGNPAFTESTNILKWVMSRSECDYNSFVSWSWASDAASFLPNLVARTASADCWVYLQLDWVAAGTTNIIGSHAITCCGYALAEGTDGSYPSNLTGLFIIDSDNDKRTGEGGRNAPNTINFIPVRYDATKGKFFLDYPGACGMMRFMCYLKTRPVRAAPVATTAASVAVPYEWLRRYGLYDPTGDESANDAVLRHTGKVAGGRPLSVWHDYVAGTDPTDPDDAFAATISITNGEMKVGWMPDLGCERVYRVFGKTNLTDNVWHYPTNSGSRFFRVEVMAHDAGVGCGFGVIPEWTLLATNRYELYKGVPSLILPEIVDAEKIDGTDLDDMGCGEAVGANMAVLTGWAQRAGFANEDELFRAVYIGDGTASGGTYSVVKFVFDKIVGEDMTHYYAETEEFSLETFKLMEKWLSEGRAVGVKYLHGTPSSNTGDHVVTVWGVCKDARYLPSDPRHYCAVIISDSDDDKHGYDRAEDAPNRIKVWPVTWNDREGVYEIDDGFLICSRSLAPCE